MFNSQSSNFVSSHLVLKPTISEFQELTSHSIKFTILLILFESCCVCLFRSLFVFPLYFYRMAFSFLLNDSYTLRLAGVVGLEPTNVGAKVLCLTIWRYPNVVLILLPFYFTRTCLSTVKYLIRVSQGYRCIDFIRGDL